MSEEQKGTEDGAERAGMPAADTAVAGKVERTAEPSDAAGPGESFEVILASGSPRRRQLLADAGVAFRVQTPLTPVDESLASLDPDIAACPPEACKKLAEKKAGAVVQDVLADDFTGMAAIIGADTMVVLGDQIFGKPKSLSDAKGMLRKLSGRTHEVMTAVSLWLVSAPDAERVSLGFRTFIDIARVTFRELSDQEIDDYLRKGESFDKAGAYAVQGEGAALVEHVDGSLSTVIGLPVERLLADFPDLAASKS